MKITIKSKEQLLADGWKIGFFKDRCDRDALGIFFPAGKKPIYYLSEWQMDKLCGQEIEVIEAQLEGDNPRYRIRKGNYEEWVSWKVLEADLGTKKPKFKLKVVELPRGKVQIINEDHFKFDCSLSNMTADQVRRTIKKLAPIVGLEVY